MHKLMERKTAGFEVALILDEGEIYVRGATEQYRKASPPLDPTRAMEAFQHPCTFIPDAHLFFARNVEVSWDDDEGHGAKEHCACCDEPLTTTETTYCDDCREDAA